ncbi:MAG: N-acetyl sugar amidotransferase [Rhizobacter sp.]|nr:N-acetyl sugar amidotransferase [Rhizobacter sp.]
MAYRICSVCVMDDSNPTIQFDTAGQCDCCRDSQIRMPHEWWPGAEGHTRMDAMVRTLKEGGQGKPYDVMIGLSGGIDSAYLAHLAVRELGLRVLAVHVDGGWNSEPAVRNIESIVRALDIDLHTYVVEWREMKDLQVALLKASVLNQDMPQDHAFFATLYRTAAKFGLRHFLSGVNFASENVVPRWGFPSMDGKHLKALHSRFGIAPLDSYPIMPLTEFLWLTRVRKVLTVHRPLNYLAYDKEAARLELTCLYGWRDYGGKHCESRFTKFYQELYLPRKFGFDKRRLHLSSLIVSGQLTREAALEELAQPITFPDQARRDLKFVAKKLGLSVDELNTLIESPAVDHLSYPNQMALHRRLTTLKGLLRRRIGAATTPQA